MKQTSSTASVSGGKKGESLLYAEKGSRLRHRHGERPASSIEVADPQESAFHKADAHKSFWVEPGLLAEIEYRPKSTEGKVRHPFFKGPARGLRGCKRRASRLRAIPLRATLMPRDRRPRHSGSPALRRPWINNRSPNASPRANPFGNAKIGFEFEHIGHCLPCLCIAS
jgi:hypothetical protein